MDEGSRPVEIPRFVPCIEVPASSTSAKSEMRSSEHLAGTHPISFLWEKHEKAERSPSTALRPGAAASSAAPGTPGDSRDSGEARSPQGGPPGPLLYLLKKGSSTQDGELLEPSLHRATDSGSAGVDATGFSHHHRNIRGTGALDMPGCKRLEYKARAKDTTNIPVHRPTSADIQ